VSRATTPQHSELQHHSIPSYNAATSRATTPHNVIAPLTVTPQRYSVVSCNAINAARVVPQQQRRNVVSCSAIIERQHHSNNAMVEQ